METPTSEPPTGSRKVPIKGASKRTGAIITVDYALVSEEDYEKVRGKRWSMAGRGYARCAGKTSDGRFRSVYLHRFVMGEPEGLQVDHRNGDKLDCRRENLRVATNSQNHAGYSSRPPGASGERGVYLQKGRETFEARVTHQGREHRKTGFRTVEEAVIWRDKKGRELHGEHYFAAELAQRNEAETEGETDGD